MSPEIEAESGPPIQRIVRIRREYNAWVADETIEDYALRYTPSSFRKWSEFRVANTALGAVSFLALEAIGASIAVDYGFCNAFWAILVVSVFIFVTAIPVCLYAARHAVDIDLLARGSGFGYLGSTLSSFIYASFTFIFFSLEAVIMASALEVGLGIPLWLGYLLCSIAVIPLVAYGITAISHIQLWTQPLWLVLLVLPYLFLLIRHPQELHGLLHASYGINDGHFDWLAVGPAATVVASMVAQVGEQVDFLRFMPEARSGRQRVRWWAALLAAGPGWIVVGGAKMLGGAVLAFLAIRQGLAPGAATRPTQMYLVGYAQVFHDHLWVVVVTCLFVMVSQIKIIMANAYAGSLAWSNFFSRLTHAHPGRLVWLVFNVLIGVALIKIGIFDVLEGLLGFYANFAVAWIGALVADLVVNKPLGLSPPGIEFRRAYLYDINPVGFVSLALGTVLALAAFVGAFGRGAQACSVVIGFGVAFCCAPLIAWITQGRYYVARRQAPFQRGSIVTCGVCEKRYEAEDMAQCPAYGCAICSLCCTLDARCQDTCKPPQASIARQVGLTLRRLASWRPTVALSRRLHYMLSLLGLAVVLGAVLSFVVSQETHILFELAPDSPARWNLINIKICFGLVLLAGAIGACWLLLSSDSRRVAQDESHRQATLLRDEIMAHEVTERQLQEALQLADRSNLAKSRFLTNISHELRTPLNSILGYAQILQRELELSPSRRGALEVIRKSGDHLISLIDGLLDIARIEARRLKIVSNEIHCRSFLDQLADLFRLEATRKGIRFDYEPSPKLPPAFRGDEKRIAQVLINLLGNAIKYTTRGQVTFRIQYATDIAVFEIRDSGPGISPENLERIFEPFERVENSGAGSEGAAGLVGGVGLGLTISKTLTELMGGELKVHSQLGMGSSFTVRLSMPSVVRPLTPVEQWVTRHICGYRGERRRVMVVDDAAVDRQMLCDLLEPLGFVVLPVASGMEALRVAGEFRPDLIVLDIEMPQIDGWETARLFRANGISAAPILIVSANGFGIDQHEEVGVGKGNVLLKPIKIDVLLEWMRLKLALEWINSEALPDADDPAPPAMLPADSVLALRKLGELGYVRGILEKLDELDRLDGAYGPITRSLRALVERFDMHGFESKLAQLNE